MQCRSVNEARNDTKKTFPCSNTTPPASLKILTETKKKIEIDWSRDSPLTVSYPFFSTMCPQWFHSAFLCWQLLKPTKNNLLLRQLMWFKISHSTAWSPNKVLDKLPPTKKYEIHWCIRLNMIDFLSSDISSRFKHSFFTPAQHTALRYYSLLHKKTCNRSLTADWNQVKF